MALPSYYERVGSTQAENQAFLKERADYLTSLRAGKPGFSGRNSEFYQTPDPAGTTPASLGSSGTNSSGTPGGTVTEEEIKKRKKTTTGGYSNNLGTPTLLGS